ncbi:MAG: DNA gyrase inhibitor YacG [Deltaproteobacteria bacterium]|nr:DNA gyrase inhibitor YacG [Deltaproteobacteria bacterium]
MTTPEPPAPQPAPTKKKILLCPTCGNLTTWQDNPWRPFCSERCKTLDLAAWAEEKYAIPGGHPPQSDEEEG